MKESDIDKLFKDQFDGAELPTEERDWLAFESLYNKRNTKPGFGWLLAVLGLFLALTAGYYFFGNHISVENENRSQSANETVNKKLDTDALNSAKKWNSDEIKKPDSLEINESITETIVEKNKSNNSSTNQETSSSTKHENGITSNNAKVSDSIDSHVISSPTGANPIKKKTNDTPYQEPLYRSTETKLVHLPTTVAENIITPELALMEMHPASEIEIALKENAVAITSLKSMDSTIGLNFDLFVGIEQNNMLRTSPFIGINASLRRSRWIYSAGVGYQQSGSLNWSQESSTVEYGFNRYESMQSLITRSVDLILIPVKVSYQVSGRSDVFLGFTSSFIVNASQEFSAFDDVNPASNSSESGYLYHTGAPDFIYFISGGYSFLLSEKIKLDGGINYSFQNWETSTKLPFGVFVRAHYIFK